jgi:hypothetical protein
VADAVKLGCYEVALAIREVGAMIEDRLDTIEKHFTGGWKLWGKEG